MYFLLSVKEEKDKVEVVFNGSIDKGKYGKEKEEENNKEKSLPRLNPGYISSQCLWQPFLNAAAKPKMSTEMSDL